MNRPTLTCAHGQRRSVASMCIVFLGTHIQIIHASGSCAAHEASQGGN